MNASNICTVCDNALAKKCNAAGATTHDTACLSGNYLSSAGTCTACTRTALAESCGSGAAAIPDDSCKNPATAPGNWNNAGTCTACA